MNKTQYTAEVIRDILTSARADLYMGSKTVIRRLIENAIQKAEQDYADYARRKAADHY